MPIKPVPTLATLLLLGLLGCVTNPITGERQFNMVSQNALLAMSKQAVPEQFAADYGVLADRSLNAYVQRVGQRLLATLKPADMVYANMPFSFQVVNATYVNAYAFPGGSIAITRGMLLELENEAQLAAVLGHEIALQHLNKLESRGSSDARISLFKGVAYEGLNRKAEAVASYNQYLTRSQATSAEGTYARQRLQQLAPPPAPR